MNECTLLPPFVSVIVGSESDMSTIEDTLTTLRSLGAKYEIRILSAHRTPLDLHAYVEDADQRGAAVFIAGAGLAAHLAGAIAARTIKPVIGVPMDGGPLNGFDALISTVQMPPGVPVACVAIGKAGARNAAYLAAQILALHDPDLVRELHKNRSEVAIRILESNKSLTYGGIR